MKKRYNKNNNLDTSAETLNEFYRKTGNEVFKLMLDLRKERSRKSTYIDAQFDKDGRMRCTYDVSGTETGRLSSKKTPLGHGMNLQNVTKEYRTLFVVDEGFVFLGADLSQAENRVVAYLCEDEKMMSVVNSEGDIHTNNAALIFDKPEEDVMYEERQLGKRITHGCLLPDAEVLTKQGWVQFKDLKEGVKIAQFDPKTKEIEFVVPEICKFSHDGIMYEARGHGHRNVYTPGHRLPYVSRGDYQAGREKIQFKHVVDVVEMGARPGKLPVSGSKKDSDLKISDDFIKLLVIVQTQMMFKDNTIEGIFKNDDKRDSFIEILENLNIDYNVRKARKNNHVRIGIRKLSRITRYFKDDKIFGDWIYRLSYRSLRVFMDAIQFWTGSSNETNWLYNTTIKANAEIVQTAAHLCGYIASLNTYKEKGSDKKRYRVIVREGCYVGLRKEHWSSHKYTGDVYSLKVPKTSYLTRYDNCIMVTGNTNYMMGAITFAKYAGVPTSEARVLMQKYHSTYPKLRFWHKEIAKKIRQDRELINPFGRKRHFNDRMGNSLFREAVAYLPQSTVADAIHRATIEIYAKLPHPARMVLNLHDAVTLQVPDDEEWIEECSEILETALTRPFEIDGKTISIPTEVLKGYNWKEVS